MAGLTSRDRTNRDVERASSPAVLVVDEDPSDSCQYCALLRVNGYQVHCTCSYGEGEACLNERPLDFVIVSQGSRAFEGRRIAKRAVRKDVKVLVLVLARHPDMGCYIEAMSLGASDYWQKPVSPDKILEYVTEQTGS